MSEYTAYKCDRRSCKTTSMNRQGWFSHNGMYGPMLDNIWGAILYKAEYCSAKCLMSEVSEAMSKWEKPTP